MKSYELLEVIGEAQDSYVIDAKASKKKSTPVWIKWAAMAACLCLIISLAVPIYIHNKPGGGDGPGLGGQGITPGGVPGDWSGDIDPNTASVAVFPDTEELKNVASATLSDIDEATAYSFDKLGSYLPTHLVAGYHFAKGSLYETAMKDGAKYYQLRVTFADGNISEADPTIDPETGEQSKDSPAITSNSYMVWIMNYNPGKEYTIHSGDELTDYIKNLPSNGAFFFKVDDLFVGFAPSDLSSDEVMAVINSMR